MPVINLHSNTYKKPRYERLKETDKKNNINFKSVYNTNTWRKIRLQFLMQNPLCGRCLKLDKINSAVDVHHIIPISTVDTIIEKRTLGFDWNNLESLCIECHKKEHKK